jgi:DMSO/TMAO reductase YedYZ molybdopterin-dependent catalytic subunit
LGGLTLAMVADLAEPAPEARFVVFSSFGEGLHGGEYYDSLSLANSLHLQTLLAYEMNGERLPPLYGAPLRLRVENQLGYNMVKWIR